MRVTMSKFGVLLNSRPAGREAALRLFQIVNGSGKKEDVVLDFSGVEVLTPSFADEFLHKVKEKYGTDKVKIENTDTKVVREAIDIIENEPTHK